MTKRISRFYPITVKKKTQVNLISVVAAAAVVVGSPMKAHICECTIHYGTKEIADLL